MRIVAPMPQEAGPRQNQQKINFFARRFQTTSKQKCSNVRPLLSITFPQGFRISKNIGHPTLGKGGKKTLKRYLKSEENEEKILFFARRFQTIFKQKCSYLRPLLSITFLQGFRISKNIGHPTSGSGGKKNVKRYLKSEHTDRQTDRRTDKRRFRLIESIGLEGRCLENKTVPHLQRQHIYN